MSQVPLFYILSTIQSLKTVASPFVVFKACRYLYATYTRRFIFRGMEFEVENYYQLFDDSEDNNFCIVNDHETVSNEAAQMGKADNALSISPIKLMNTSLQSSVICGVLTGLLITLLWWIELNVRDYCTKDWDAIPNSFHRKELVVDSVEVIIVSLWPVLTIAPICQWSMIKESNILVWCSIAGLADALNRLSQYMLGYYDERWKSYMGNVIFLLISFVVFLQNTVSSCQIVLKIRF